MDAWNCYRYGGALLDLRPPLADRFDLIDSIGPKMGYYPVEIRWNSQPGAW